MGSTKKTKSQEERQTTQEVVNTFADVQDIKVKAEKLSSSIQHREDEQRSSKQNFNVSRELMRQLTPNRPVNGNLFTILADEPKNLEEARKLEQQGGLLSILTDGINAGALGKKAVFYIAKELYRQAALFAPNGDPIKDGFKGIVEHGRKQGVYAERKIYGETYPCVFIEIKLSEMTKSIKTANATDNRKDVDNIIKKLCESKTFWKSTDNKCHLEAQIINIECQYTNEDTKQIIYLLQVKPLFYMSISTGYITASAKSFDLLKKIKKEIGVNLFLYLLELHSFKNDKQYPNIRRLKETADARIIPDYYIRGSRKKDLKRDFEKAEDMMIQGELLLKEGITLEMNPDGATLYYVFHLNPNYTSATKQLPQKT